MSCGCFWRLGLMPILTLKILGFHSLYHFSMTLPDHPCYCLCKIQWSFIAKLHVIMHSELWDDFERFQLFYMAMSRPKGFSAFIVWRPLKPQLLFKKNTRTKKSIMSAFSISEFVIKIILTSAVIAFCCCSWNKI